MLKSDSMDGTQMNKPFSFYLCPGETVPLENLLAWIVQRDLDTEWEVRIREYKESKSDAQNRLQLESSR